VANLIYIVHRDGAYGKHTPTLFTNHYGPRIEMFAAQFETYAIYR
jgi:hypothetical protein